MVGSRSAGGSLAGYLWQVTEGCRRALSLRGDEVLSIERHDDLAIARLSGVEICVEQLKHSLHRGTITHESVDWWSAIDAWMATSQPAISKRVLVTTDAIGSGSTLGECYLPRDIAPWDKLVDAMDGVARAEPNAKFRNRGTYQKWIDLARPNKRMLLESISIRDQAPGIRESIRLLDEEISRESVPTSAIEATRNSFLGAMVAKVTTALEHDGIEIPRREIRAAFMTAASRAIEEGHYDLPEIAIDADAIEELRRNKNLHMIPQLKAIRRDTPTGVVRALERWFQARHHRERLLNGTAHSIADLRSHDRDLVANNENHHERHTDAPEERHEAVGQEVYHACMGFQARLGKSNATVIFAQGSYYELSNDLRVRWHPKYARDDE